MKKLLFVAIIAVAGAYTTNAQEIYADTATEISTVDTSPIDESLFKSMAREKEAATPQRPTKWFFSFQAGATFTFGDDSWNIFDDWKSAKGTAFSFSIGRKLSNLLSVRLNGRYLDLFSRCNLEVYEGNKDKYPGLFPRDGFYQYSCFAIQGEVLLNLTNLIHHDSDKFNIYLIGGGGFNRTFRYQEQVENWYETYPGVDFYVNTNPHSMPVGVIGGMLDFRISRELSFNFETLASFTGDNLEGVVYEEPYDVYLTLSLGATFHF